MRILRSLPIWHLNPENPDGQEQVPSIQVPPFKQEKWSGQAKKQNKRCLPHNKYSKTISNIEHNDVFALTMITTNGCAFIAPIWAIILTVAFPFYVNTCCCWIVNIQSTSTLKLVQFAALRKIIKWSELSILHKIIYIYIWLTFV